MTPLSRTPAQALRVATRVRGVFVVPEVAPTATAVLVNGQARALAVSRVSLMDGNALAPAPLPGQYAFVFDGSSLAIGDVVEVLFTTRAGGRNLDGCVAGRVCAASGYGAPGLVSGGGPILPPPSGGDGPLFGASTHVAAGGNSFFQQLEVSAQIEHYVNARLPGGTVQFRPPPHLPSTIADGDDGFFPNMTLGGMALFPTIDQRQPDHTGTTDLIDALASQPQGTYDYVALVSGFVQEATGVGGIEAETVPGSGADTVVLEVKRRVVQELASRLGPFTGVVIRMTHEGYRTNRDTDLTQVERRVRLQVLAARQLESEGIVSAVVPEHYVWSRLQYGAFGPAGTALTDPVPAYVDLEHSQSSQPGRRNYGWLNRTTGDSGPFQWNSHQNAIAAVVAAWTWGYAMWGIDPRGDTTFSAPAGLPHPLDDFISADGRIYGGHRTGLGIAPYDPAVNPGGPPDSELDLAWTDAIPQIQDRIVAAVDDYVAGTTEFD